MSSNIDPALELAQLEIEAKANAQKNVAGLLQRPDQLDKVEQIRKRISRKKSSVEAMLKTSIQSQLDGVRTGLNQLKNGLNDIKRIRENLAGVDASYKSIAGLGETLSEVREENSRHSQLAAAVENLKHIFTVPETAKKCQEMMNEGKLLHAHKCLTDLESSRDDLLYELSRQARESPTDKNLVMSYFGDVEKLSTNLGKQLWLVLQRAIMTVRKEPTIIVTVLRIIEREERTDMVWNKKFEQTGFLPPGRPKRWRQKAFSVLEDAVCARIEGSQMADRTTDKMWLVRHLEVIRQLTVEDLRVIKTLCESCFPPHYDIVNKYVSMYHNGISQHVTEVQQTLEGNEIVSLLSWIQEYDSKEFMGSPELRIDTKELGPLLEPRVINQLQNSYLHTSRRNYTEWMGKSLVTDSRDWFRDQEPDSDAKGYFNTSLPIIIFQMIEQNLQVAASINAELEVNVVKLCIDELATYVNSYRISINQYRERHLQNRAEPKYYLHYMIANINNMQYFVELVEKMRTKYLQDRAEAHRFDVVKSGFVGLAGEICGFILEEVFMDLEVHVQELMTRKWLSSSLAVDTICITLEDYCQDFVHLRPQFYKTMMKKAQDKVASDYLKAVISRKLTFRNYEERLPTAEKMRREAEQLTNLFNKLMERDSSSDTPFEAICLLSEMIKLRDTSMISFEISNVAGRYPDVKIDQLINVLQMREDVKQREARELVIQCVGEDHDIKQVPETTIFSQLYPVTSEFTSSNFGF